MLIDSLNNTRHPRIRVKSNKNKVIHSNEVNTKPKAELHITLYMQRMERRMTETGYIIDCVDNRLLLCKWLAVYFQAPEQASLSGT